MKKGLGSLGKQIKRQSAGLYRTQFEHDNCGIGAVVNIKGVKTAHETVADALKHCRESGTPRRQGCGRQDRRRCWYHGSDFP